MKDRIRQLMESQHMTQQTFAQFIEMSPASLSSIFNGRTRPTLNTVEAIRKKIPSISLEWLVLGKGPMFLDNVSENPPSESSSDTLGDLFSNIEREKSPSSQGNTLHISPHSGTDSKPLSQGDIKYVEKVPRQITEIRVFFDDQTYESFVPKK